LKGGEHSLGGRRPANVFEVERFGLLEGPSDAEDDLHGPERRAFGRAVPLQRSIAK
jgi:hypothetical protein